MEVSSSLDIVMLSFGDASSAFTERAYCVVFSVLSNFQ